MDELHDAIQDAQYIGAVTNAHRGPSAAFYTPTSAEVSQFVDRQERTLGADWLAIENMLDLPLGFYFMRRFCDAEQHGGKKLDFLVNLTRFRSLVAPEQRVAKALEIWDTFFSDTPSTPSASCTPASGVASSSAGVATPTAADGSLPASSPSMASLGSPAATSLSSSINGLSLPGSPETNQPVAVVNPRQPLAGSDLNAASFTANEIVFWRKGESSVRMSDVQSIYRASISDMSPIGVGGDVVRRLAIQLRRKPPAFSLMTRASTATTTAMSITSSFRSSGRNQSLSVAAAEAAASGDGNRLSASSSRNSDAKSLSSTASFSELRTVPLMIFDEIEACVLCSLEQMHLKDFRASVFHRRLVSFLCLQTRRISEDDFTVLRILGRGGFGMVNGCIKRTSASLYAMKVMNKKMIKKKHAEKLCVAERKILAMISSPFVVCLKYAFQTPEELFLVLDLKTGGDLSFHLNRSRFTEPQVRFWAAQILLGLHHLHEKNVVYRDLKPENILLDEKGNCSISDLGLAVEITPTLSGRCGTRGYWAPEMLLRDENGQRMVYNHTVDWWSYGCLVYELLYGKCPFRTSKAKALHEDKQQAYDKATLELTPTYDPKYFSPEAADLIQRESSVSIIALCCAVS